MEATLTRNRKKVVMTAMRQEQINMRLNQMPQTCRGVYRKAVSGKSLRAAVNAFCLECVGYQRIEIHLCTDLGCPLFAQRPFQRSKQATDVSIDG
ncbi:MAG: hypothetical protein ISS70_10175 [Phycisphaerae bacterium]|nr:hypothetical protein [Phycisphaerae bacterium]